MTKTYKNPQGFKAALKERITKRARAQNQTFNRVQQLLIFERFLARVYLAHPGSVVLKGGLLMELRLRQANQIQARTTKDIDVRLVGNLDEAIKTLQKQCNEDFGDWMRFRLHDPQPIAATENNPETYDGATLKVECLIANKLYGSSFKIDIGVADGFVGPEDELVGDDFFGFCGLEPITHHVYPVEMHLAEKLHALSLEFKDGKENSRLKDLIDVGLLIQTQSINADRLNASMQATFDHRKTHAIPEQLPDVPDSWHMRYENEKTKHDLIWDDLDALLEACRAFYNTKRQGTWSVDRWHV